MAIACQPTIKHQSDLIGRLQRQVFCRRQTGIKPGKLIGIRQRIGDIAESLFVRRPKHDVALPSRQPDYPVGQLPGDHFQMGLVPRHDHIDLRRIETEMMQMGGPERRLGHGKLLSVGEYRLLRRAGAISF